ncbi:hypothetical protein M6B38_227225 [Iris pallida]|uniref:Uncharacterized protein n=1 Tax=Iris pallida TaxID=29817 RepID=A0AAX6DTL0_IRIPA|nr:hypothetical protein M6B38_227225 [Iris pallida]
MQDPLPASRSALARPAATALPWRVAPSRRPLLASLEPEYPSLRLRAADPTDPLPMSTTIGRLPPVDAPLRRNSSLEYTLRRPRSSHGKTAPSVSAAPRAAVPPTMPLFLAGLSHHPSF